MGVQGFVGGRRDGCDEDRKDKAVDGDSSARGQCAAVQGCVENASEGRRGGRDANRKVSDGGGGAEWV